MCFGYLTRWVPRITIQSTLPYLPYLGLFHQSHVTLPTNQRDSLSSRRRDPRSSHCVYFHDYFTSQKTLRNGSVCDQKKGQAVGRDTKRPLKFSFIHVKYSKPLLMSFHPVPVTLRLLIHTDITLTHLIVSVISSKKTNVLFTWD